jgi:DNA invertase Pin-like site-specific DNA recombinase
VGGFGDVVISLLATVARLERERISERTKAGLARVRASGVRLGRRPRTDIDMAQVRKCRAQGKSYRALAVGLKCSPIWLCRKFKEWERTAKNAAGKKKGAKTAL